MRKHLSIAMMAGLVLLGCKQRSSKEKQADPYAELKQQVLGKWGDEKRRASLEIMKDSVYSYGWIAPNPYFFKADTFYVKFADRDTATRWGQMVVRGDTLLIIEPNFNGTDQTVTTYGYRCK